MPNKLKKCFIKSINCSSQYENSPLIRYYIKTDFNCVVLLTLKATNSGELNTMAKL